MLLTKDTINEALSGHCVMVRGYVGGVINVVTKKGRRPILICAELGTGIIKELDPSSLYIPKCPEIFTFIDNLDKTLKDKIQLIKNENIYYMDNGTKIRLKAKVKRYILVRDKGRKPPQKKHRTIYRDLVESSSEFSSEPRAMHILPWE